MDDATFVTATDDWTWRMRIVAISDLHLDHVTAGVPRFDEISEVVLAAVNNAIITRADLFVCLGDVFDPDSGSIVFKCATFLLQVAQQLASREIPSCWVAGNHDVIEDGSGFTTLSPLRMFKKNPYVHLFEKPGSVMLKGGVEFVAFPFTATSHPYNPMDVVLPEGPAIIGSHLHVAGIQPGEETTELPRGREVLLPYEHLDQARRRKDTLLLSGHYHKRQRFTPPGGRLPIEVIGTPARLTFGESNNVPGYLTIEF